MDPEPEAPATTFDRAWDENHRQLVALASRMLRDAAAAEDIVQDAFARLAGVRVEEIEDVGAWLSVVVRRLCLNRIYSAYARREAVVDTLEAGPPEPTPRPASAGGDPADRVTLDDQVRLALAVVLDRLTPAERTAFLLHDVFGFPFDVIGQMVGRTATACRQLASRARRAIRSAPPPQVVPTAREDVNDQHVVLAQRFIDACTGGDIDALVAVLDPDVTGLATWPDGRQVGPGTAIEGADTAAARLIELFGPGTGTELVPVALEDRPGVVAVLGGQVRAVMGFDPADGVVRHIRAIVLRPSAQ